MLPNDKSYVYRSVVVEIPVVMDDCHSTLARQELLALSIKFAEKESYNNYMHDSLMVDDNSVIYLYIYKCDLILCSH